MISTLSTYKGVRSIIYSTSFHANETGYEDEIFVTTMV